MARKAPQKTMDVNVVFAGNKRLFLFLEGGFFDQRRME